ncbi:SRPBCC family protein [Microlunatus speluncae]|uniref:SRPBCC family protein n=1 Tax=Microlunatus speluncae TaxID=2594267 RepID=UPI00126610F0|nr:SRPBCC family protein [Microlunatus speluncae]
MSDNDKITVTRTIDASADALFDVLGNPRRHPELDGSGFIRGVGEQADRLQQVGDLFTMEMSGDHMGGDYKTDNRVTGLVPNKLIAWKTAPAGTEPPGWEWVWELDPLGPDRTEVSLTYDWSQVSDPDLLAKIKFPLVPQEALEDSLAKLAATAA